MARYYDKGTHVELQIGDDVYYIPKGTFLKRRGDVVEHKFKEAPPLRFKATPDNVEIPHSADGAELAQNLSNYFYRTNFDNAAEEATAFDGTDTTVGFTEVTTDHECIVTVVSGEVTGDLTTTTDPANNEVTVETDNPDDSGVLHVELVSNIGLL